MYIVFLWPYYVRRPIGLTSNVLQIIIAITFVKRELRHRVRRIRTTLCPTTLYTRPVYIVYTDSPPFPLLRRYFYRTRVALGRRRSRARTTTCIERILYAYRTSGRRRCVCRRPSAVARPLSVFDDDAAANHRCSSNGRTRCSSAS